MKKFLTILLLLTCTALSGCTGGADIPTPTDTTEASTETETETTTNSDTPIEETTLPETEAPAPTVYYVRTPEQPPEKANITYPVHKFDSYKEAVAKANHPYLAATGYAVYSESGEFLYGLNNEYVTNMLYWAKYITDFARINDYQYGSAAKNSAQTYHFYMEYGRLREKVVSCDRFVGWVLYEMGYTDQPSDAGMFVWGNAQNRDHNLMIYLDKHHYERIDHTTDFKAGDIVFVNPTQSSGGEPFGAHVFICAGSTGRGNHFFRYDHGSNSRIQSVQPSKEVIENLFCVYRPTQTTLEDTPNEP